MKHIRDGFVIVQKISETCKRLIDKFRGIPVFRKLALLIGRLMQAVGAINMYKGASDALKELKVVRELNNEIYEEWKHAQEQFDNYSAYSNLNEHEVARQSPEAKYVYGKYAEPLIRVLRGLVIIFIGTVTTEITKGGPVGDSMPFRDGALDAIKSKIANMWKTIKSGLSSFYDNSVVGKYVSILLQTAGALGTSFNLIDSVRNLDAIRRHVIPALRGIANHREIVGDTLASLCRSLGRMLISFCLMKLGRVDSKWSDDASAIISKIKSLFMKASVILKSIINRFGSFLQNNGFGRVLRHIIEVCGWISLIKFSQAWMTTSQNMMAMLIEDIGCLTHQSEYASVHRISTITTLMKSATKLMMSTFVLFKVINLGRDKKSKTVQQGSLEDLDNMVGALKIPEIGYKHTN